MPPERKMMQKVKKNDEREGGPLSYAHITGCNLLGQNHFMIYHSIMHLSVCIVEKWILLYDDIRPFGHVD